MVHDLLLEEEDSHQVESVTKFSRFLPHSMDFLDTTNPNVVL
jgi:hypothetical protein